MFIGGEIHIEGNQSDIANLKQIIEEENDEDISEFKNNTDEFLVEENDDFSFAIVYDIYEATRPEKHFSSLMEKYPNIEWIFSHGIDDTGDHSAMGNRFIVFKNGEMVFEEYEWYNASDYMDSDEDVDSDELLEKISAARSEGEDTFFFTCRDKWENKKSGDDKDESDDD